MIQIRPGTFETNSSSNHSLAYCTVQEFLDFVNGDTLFNTHYRSPEVALRSVEEYVELFKEFNAAIWNNHKSGNDLHFPDDMPTKDVLTLSPNAAFLWLNDDYYSCELFEEGGACPDLFFPENYLGEFPKKSDVIRFVFAYPERYDKYLKFDPDRQKYMTPTEEDLCNMGFFSFFEFAYGNCRSLMFRQEQNDAGENFVDLHYRQH